METINTAKQEKREYLEEKAVSRGFREALKYSSITTILSKFCNVELELLNRYGTEENGITLEHPEGIRKYIVELEKVLFGVSGLKVEDAAIDDPKIKEFIQSFAFCGTEEQTILTYNGVQRACEIYLRQPRANSVSMRLTLTEGTEFTLQNYYNIYPNEGFLISFALEDMRVTFLPESKEGKKGAGDVYVYVFRNGKIRRAPLSDYVPTAGDVLKMFRG